MARSVWSGRNLPSVGEPSAWASLTVRGSTVSGNDATLSGGGIGNGGQLLLRGTTVAHIDATLTGGGIFINDPPKS